MLWKLTVEGEASVATTPTCENDWLIEKSPRFRLIRPHEPSAKDARPDI